MNQLELRVPFQIGDVVTFKNLDTKHQLGKETCEVMAVEGDVVKLIRQGSELNRPKHWIQAEIKDIELFSESEKVAKTLEEVKSDQDVGQKNNDQSEIEKTSTTASKNQKEIPDLKTNLTNLDEKSPTICNEEYDSKCPVDTISETNGYDQLSLNIDNNLEIKFSSDSKNPDENKQSSLNSKSDSSNNSMAKKPNDNPIKPFADNNSKDSIINISQIIATPETQSRCKLDPKTIKEYADLMKSGVIFPPVILYSEGKDSEGKKWHLADGFHRLEAAKKCNLSTINAEIREGSKSDAVLYSVGANATHGLRRTSADKKKAVETVLKNDEWKKWSSNEIAKICGVSHPFVGKIRKELYPNQKSEERIYNDKHGNTKVMNTGNIGKNHNKSSQTKKEDTHTTQPTLFDLECSTQPINSTNNEKIENSEKDNNQLQINIDKSVNSNGKNNNYTKDNNWQRLQENFKFVKSEILNIVSLNQQTEVANAFNLIDSVLDRYLKKLS